MSSSTSGFAGVTTRLSIGSKTMPDTVLPASGSSGFKMRRGSLESSASEGGTWGVGDTDCELGVGDTGCGLGAGLAFAGEDDGWVLLGEAADAAGLLSGWSVITEGLPQDISAKSNERQTGNMSICLWRWGKLFRFIWNSSPFPGLLPVRIIRADWRDRIYSSKGTASGRNRYDPAEYSARNTFRGAPNIRHC